MKTGEHTAHHDRYFTWVRKHYGAGPCKFCDHIHDGYHTYSTHLQAVHPEKWSEFCEWAGIKEDV